MKVLMKIYVVYGTHGEYSDREIWPVGAFYSEDKAKQLILNASEEARRIYLLAQEKAKSRPMGRDIYYWRRETPEEIKMDDELKAWFLDFRTDKAMKNKYDKKRQQSDVYDPETTYYYEEVELIDEQ